MINSGPRAKTLFSLVTIAKSYKFVHLGRKSEWRENRNPEIPREESECVETPMQGEETCGGHKEEK